MKKYKEEAYKGYTKFVKETYKDNQNYKLASIAWLSKTNLKIELEAPYILYAKKKCKPRYLFCPKTYCLIDFSEEVNRKYAKNIVYSALWRMNKELDEIGEKVEGRPQ